jgi:hypothetical protein
MPIRVFRCPNCNKAIDTTMSQCRYCAVPIDPNAAEAAATLQEKVNQAGFDAAIVKQLAIWMPVSLLVMFLPIVGFIGLLGFYVLIIAVPIFLIRWWIKFRGIKTTDPNFKSAKRSILIAVIIWALFMVPGSLRLLL